MCSHVIIAHLLYIIIPALVFLYGMGISTASLLSTVGVLYVNHIEAGRPPYWLRNVMFHYCARFLCMKSIVPEIEDDDGNHCNKVGDVKGETGGSSLKITVAPAENEATDGAKVIKAFTNKPSDQLNSLEQVVKALLENQVAKEEGSEYIHEWKAVARVLDRGFFWVFSILSFLGTLSLYMNAFIRQDNNSNRSP